MSRYVVVEIIRTVDRPTINVKGGFATLAYTFDSEDGANTHVMKRLMDWKGSKVETKSTSDLGKWYDGIEYAVTKDNGESIRLQILFDRSQLTEALSRKEEV